MRSPWPSATVRPRHFMNNLSDRTFLVSNHRDFLHRERTMIAHLTGRLRSNELESIVVDVRGVGYEVDIPIGTVGRITEDDQGDVSLWIHTSVREDAIQLYGFASRDDRRLFRRLINVNGVGPRTGLATLSELSPSEVISAVRREDIKTFQRVKGIGKKTAQRLILEMKSSIDDLIIDAPAPRDASSIKRYDDLRSALLNLGYQSSTIDGVVDELRGEVDGDETVEALLRRSLQMLK